MSEDRKEGGPMTRITCPRRAENGMDQEDGPFVGSGKDLDTFSPKHGLVSQPVGCSYCGSLPPDDFMAWVREGCGVEPTDKNYKAYITHPQHGHAKFYFQHLSEEQMREFVDLLNTDQIKFGYPGHFYVRPFFIKSAPLRPRGDAA